MEKKVTPQGERKEIEEWSSTIDELLLSCIQECGHWGWPKVDIVCNQTGRIAYKEYVV